MKRLLLTFAAIFLMIPQSTYATEIEVTVNDLGTIMFIGDSYCTGTNVNSDSKETPELGWAQKTVDNLGIENYIIACKGGTGFVHSHENTTFQSLLDDYYPGETDAQKVGWIIVGGGYNDQYYSYDEIMIKGEEFVNHANELYPNASIAIGMNGWHETDTEISGILSATVIGAYHDLAEYKGANYIYGTEYVLYRDGVMSNDGLHPNAEGEQLIADAVSSFLNDQIDKIIQAIKEERLKAGMQNVNIKIPLIITGMTILAIIFIYSCRIGLERRKTEEINSAETEPKESE